jgi:hypothetical protein
MFSSPLLGPKYPPVKWLPIVISLGIKVAEADNSPPYLHLLIRPKCIPQYLHFPLHHNFVVLKQKIIYLEPFTLLYSTQ